MKWRGRRQSKNVVDTTTTYGRAVDRVRAFDRLDPTMKGAMQKLDRRVTESAQDLRKSYAKIPPAEPR